MREGGRERGIYGRRERGGGIWGGVWGRMHAGSRDPRKMGLTAKARPRPFPALTFLPSLPLGSGQLSHLSV